MDIESGSPAEGKPRSRGWQWVRRAVAIALSLVGVVFLVLIVPDQLAPSVAPPPPALLPRKPTASPVETTAARDGAAVSTAPLAASAEPTSDTLEALKASVRPFPDLAALPEEKRAGAEAFNREMDEATMHLVALVAASRGLSSSAARRSLEPFRTESTAAQNRHPHLLSREQYFDFLKRKGEAWERARMQVAFEHEDWQYLWGEYFWRDEDGLLGKAPPDPTNWENAKHYMRLQDGWGRVRIAFFSCIRPLLALKRRADAAEPPPRQEAKP